MRPDPTRVAARWLSAGAKGVRDLPLGVYVSIEASSSGIRVAFTDFMGEEQPQLPVQGAVDAYPPAGDTGPCLGAFIIRHSKATSGWGPFLYDLVMEAAGAKGLTPDRRTVSTHAFRVWDFYMSRRPDVKTRQLDWGPNSPKHLDTDPKNDCVQTSTVYHDPVDEDLTASPLAKVYYAKGKPLTDALRRAGRLAL